MRPPTRFKSYMQFIDGLGLMAGTLTTLSFIPQVLKIWQSKSGRDVSYGMFFMFSIGVALWLFYGWLIGATPIVVSNSLTLILAGAIIVMKFTYAKREKQNSSDNEKFD